MDEFIRHTPLVLWIVMKRVPQKRHVNYYKSNIFGKSFVRTVNLVRFWPICRSSRVIPGVFLLSLRTAIRRKEQKPSTTGSCRVIFVSAASFHLGCQERVIDSRFP